MILRRLGNKSKMAKTIVPYFPRHSIYVEPFFGAGGMFFNKPKVKYNIVNDLDGDVFNLFQIVTNRKDELIEQFEIMPIHSDLLEYWKENKEPEPLRRALRFLFLSNFTFMGKPSNIKFGTENPKAIFNERIAKTFELISDVQFFNADFREFFKILRETQADKSFIYCDPPYLGTDDNYSNSFTEQDCIGLFDCLQKSKCRFAVSEFDNEFILQQAKERALHVHYLCERRNLGNTRTEILITNYRNENTLF